MDVTLPRILSHSLWEGGGGGKAEKQGNRRLNSQHFLDFFANNPFNTFYWQMETFRGRFQFAEEKKGFVAETFPSSADF